MAWVFRKTTQNNSKDQKLQKYTGILILKNMGRIANHQFGTDMVHIWWYYTQLQHCENWFDDCTPQVSLHMRKQQQRLNDPRFELHKNNLNKLQVTYIFTNGQVRRHNSGSSARAFQASPVLSASVGGLMVIGCYWQVRGQELWCSRCLPSIQSPIVSRHVSTCLDSCRWKHFFMLPSWNLMTLVIFGCLCDTAINWSWKATGSSCICPCPAHRGTRRINGNKRISVPGKRVLTNQVGSSAPASPSQLLEAFVSRVLAVGSIGSRGFWRKMPSSFAYNCFFNVHT